MQRLSFYITDNIVAKTNIVSIKNERMMTTETNIFVFPLIRE